MADADLIVGADGVNSLVRKTLAVELGASLTYMNNRFAWFGTTKVFDTLTQTFRHTPIGDFNAHHYRYAPGRSTFIVETDEESFRRAGFERMEENEARALCEKIFADALGGARLISNNSIWRRFPQIVERALVSRQACRHRRRSPYCAFLDRLGHAAGDGRCDRAGARTA